MFGCALLYRYTKALVVIYEELNEYIKKLFYGLYECWIPGSLDREWGWYNRRGWGKWMGNMEPVAVWGIEDCNILNIY